MVEGGGKVSGMRSLIISGWWSLLFLSCYFFRVCCFLDSLDFFLFLFLEMPSEDTRHSNERRDAKERLLISPVCRPEKNKHP